MFLVIFLTVFTPMSFAFANENQSKKSSYHVHQKTNHAKHYHNKSHQNRIKKIHAAHTYIKTQPANSFQNKLVSFVHTIVNSLHYSTYRLGGTHFDPSQGIYIVDCSAYVDRVLQKIYPSAYHSLLRSSGSFKPTTEHYYQFFAQLSDKQSRYWDKIENVEELRPGDIIVFRYKDHDQKTVGHVMIVMNKPILDEDGFLVRVTDSAPSGHSKDTRMPRHHSGIGIGTLQLKVNPKTDEPNAYAWKVGAQFKKNVDIAMARPNAHLKEEIK